MSTSSSEHQSTPTNPYTAPKSSASPFIKSYLTLAVCSGLVVAAMLCGIWIYAQTGRSSTTTYERASVDERFLYRRPPVDYVEPTTAAVAPAPAAP